MSRRWRVAGAVGAVFVVGSVLAVNAWQRNSAGRPARGQASPVTRYLPRLVIQGARTWTPATPTPVATATPTAPTATEPPPRGSFEPFGVVELAPAFEVDGGGTTIDSLAFWEAPDPSDTLLLVTAKGNQRVEVWRHPFAGGELPAIQHPSFGSDTKVNGVVVDQARDLAYISVSNPASTVSVFELPVLAFAGELVRGEVNLKGEPNVALLDLAGGGQRLYISADDVVYIYDPATGDRLGDFEPDRGLETMAADAFDQIIYVPDENKRSGVYAYDPTGAPYERDGTHVFGENDVFDADAEGIVLYTCPADGTRDDGRGVILVADQKKGGTDFEVFERRAWDHLGTVQIAGVTNTDGVASTQRAMPAYPNGLFAAVNDDDTVVGVGWREILGATGIDCDAAAPTAEPTAVRTPVPTRTATVPPEHTPTPGPTRTPTPEGDPSATATPDSATGTPPTARPPAGGPRGYLTTPGELADIRRKAQDGVEPHASNVAWVVEEAGRGWSYRLDEVEKCKGAGDPSWADEERGISRLWARALAYHLTGEERYAEETAGILESIMSSILEIDWDVEGRQCQLNLSWAAPELVASADLIEDIWADRTCRGPASPVNGDRTLTTGPCKPLFQNWLAKVYYGVSYTASGSMNNWGAAATNAAAHVADYLYDRPDIALVHRQPEEVDARAELTLSAGEAWSRVNSITLDRMNGYTVDYIQDKTCDDFENASDQHDPDRPPVKGQLTELGIVPDDARRSEVCNIERYNGEYQGYPQLHVGNLVQQCELMLRRGDRRCFDNVDRTDLPAYSFPNPNTEGVRHTTHLKPGRGSVERAIKAILVDSGTEWRHDGALAVAYRYYLRTGPTLEGFDAWSAQLGGAPRCWQDICFGTLTHALAPGETPAPPPTVEPPSRAGSAR